MVLAAGNVLVHLPVHRAAVIRVHTGHGVLAVQLPRPLKGHAGHGGEAVGQKLRPQAAVLLVMHHRHAAGEIFDHGLEILLQPLLLPAGHNLVRHIPHKFYVRRDSVPVGLLKAGVEKPPFRADGHIVLFSVRRMGLQRAERTRLALSVQRCVALLPQLEPAALKQRPGLVGVEQLIVVLVDHINPVYRLVDQALEQARLRGHARKHGVKPADRGQGTHASSV